MPVNPNPAVTLARDVLSETLHGPVPMKTVARLAEAVIQLDAQLASQRRAAEELDGYARRSHDDTAAQVEVLRAERDTGWERVAELEAALRRTRDLLDLAMGDTERRFIVRVCVSEAFKVVRAALKGGG